MTGINAVPEGAERGAELFSLRPPQPGDMGWVVQVHGALYAQEYQWDLSFEGLVADIVARFMRDFDPQREACWMAERAGRNAGCVFVVRESDEVAKLRLLIVDPEARGFGIGRRLVAECIRFARLKGYQTLTLWTNDVLSAARHLYEEAGFERISTEAHHSFGHDLVGEHWNLKL